MLLRGLIEEDFTQYKEPAMFLICPWCDFKCDKENGTQICQNWNVTKEPLIDYDTDKLIQRYLENPITKSIVFGGLEPIRSFDEVKWFIHKLRWEYSCFDTVVVYTGYNADEIVDQVSCLSKYSNIIVKFGRFIPNQEPHYDPVLGINLASNNQYAEEL